MCSKFQHYQEERVIGDRVAVDLPLWSAEPSTSPTFGQVRVESQVVGDPCLGDLSVHRIHVKAPLRLIIMHDISSRALASESLYSNI